MLVSVQPLKIRRSRSSETGAIVNKFESMPRPVDFVISDDTTVTVSGPLVVNVVARSPACTVPESRVPSTVRPVPDLRTSRIRY